MRVGSANAELGFCFSSPVGTRTLLVGIQESNAFAVVEEPDREMNGDGRFPYPAFAVCERDEHEARVARQQEG